MNKREKREYDDGVKRYGRLRRKIEIKITRNRKSLTFNVAVTPRPVIVSPIYRRALYIV